MPRIHRNHPATHALGVALVHVTVALLLGRLALIVVGMAMLCVLVVLARRRLVSSHLPLAYTTVYLTVLFDLDTGFSPAALVFLVPMIFLVRDLPDRRSAFGYGMWIGTLIAVGALDWVWDVSTMFYGYARFVTLLLTLLLSSILGLRFGLFMVLAFWLRRRAPLGLVVPLVYSVVEYWSPVPFSMQVAFGAVWTPVMIQVVDLVGMWGLSALLALISGAVYTLMDGIMGRRWTVAAAGAAASAALLAFLFGYGIYGLRHYRQLPDQPTVRVAMVQPMSPLMILNADSATQAAVAEELGSMSREAMTSGTVRPDLLVWPEGAAPFSYLTPEFNPDFVRVIRSLEQEYPVAMTFQDVEFVPGDQTHKVRYFSHISMIGPGGAYLGGYRKNIPMPFTEYIPGERTFPWLRKVFTKARTVLRGDKQTLLPGPGGAFAPLICYEVLESEYVRRFVNLGARYIINYTNDRFYGASKQPWQHLAFAVFRAVENRRPVIRSTNSGISAFIDARGVMGPSNRTGILERTILHGTITPRDGQTLYGMWGDWLPRWVMTACFLWLVVYALVRRMKERKTAVGDSIAERSSEAPRRRSRRKRGGPASHRRDLHSAGG